MVQDRKLDNEALVRQIFVNFGRENPKLHLSLSYNEQDDMYVVTLDQYKYLRLPPVEQKNALRPINEMLLNISVFARVILRVADV